MRRAHLELLAYAQTVQVEPEDLIYYLIVELGRIGMNLEQFPEDRYIEMCVGSVDYLAAMRLTE